jgi:uncharacterized protein GlcG (DUF336 family)
MEASYEVRALRAEAATEMITAARSATSELGRAVTIAIVDQSGTLEALHRMDGAPHMTVQVAIDKAYTAGGFGRPTAGWDEVLQRDDVLGRGARTAIDRLVTFGGGLPIVDGGLIGGIGISGGHHTEDVEVAEAALDAVGLGPATG